MRIKPKLTQTSAWLRETRLPDDERRAARAERRAEDAIRRERDHHDERARQLAAAEAERRRWEVQSFR